MFQRFSKASKQYKKVGKRSETRKFAIFFYINSLKLETLIQILYRIYPKMFQDIIVRQKLSKSNKGQNNQKIESNGK